jgi:hypothetical protein
MQAHNVAGLLLVAAGLLLAWLAISGRYWKLKG